MYIMCFNVSICFKMGSLYSYCGIITELVYPPELSRIAGFCTNKNFLGGGPPDPPFKQNYMRLYYNHDTAKSSKKVKKYIPESPPPTIFLANSRSNGLCMSYLKSPLLIIFSRMDVWTKKSPWKVLENVPQKSLKSPWKRYVMICGNHGNINALRFTCPTWTRFNYSVFWKKYYRYFVISIVKQTYWKLPFLM